MVSNIVNNYQKIIDQNSMMTETCKKPSNVIDSRLIQKEEISKIFNFFNDKTTLKQLESLKTSLIKSNFAFLATDMLAEILTHLPKNAAIQLYKTCKFFKTVLENTLFKPETRFLDPNAVTIPFSNPPLYFKGKYTYFIRALHQNNEQAVRKLIAKYDIDANGYEFALLKASKDENGIPGLMELILKDPKDASKLNEKCISIDKEHLAFKWGCTKGSMKLMNLILTDPKLDPDFVGKELNKRLIGLNNKLDEKSIDVNLTIIRLNKICLIMLNDPKIYPRIKFDPQWGPGKIRAARYLLNVYFGLSIFIVSAKAIPKIIRSLGTKISELKAGIRSKTSLTEKIGLIFNAVMEVVKKLGKAISNSFMKLKTKISERKVHLTKVSPQAILSQ
jgi:hypothetical protein